MRRADDFKGILNLIIIVVVAAGSLLGPLLERWRKKRAEQKEAEQAPTADPEPEGAQLPYEHLVDEVFGPYMQRRRQAFAERQAAEAEEEEAEAEEAPEPPAPVPMAPEEAPRILKIDASVEAAPRHRTLEQRLFGGRNLGPAAKWILAAEILQPPKYLRRRPS